MTRTDWVFVLFTFSWFGVSAFMPLVAGIRETEAAPAYPCERPDDEPEPFPVVEIEELERPERCGCSRDG